MLGKETKNKQKPCRIEFRGVQIRPDEIKLALETAMTPRKPFKVQAIAHLLGTTVDAVRRSVDEAGIQVERQENGPKTRLFSAENLFELANWRHRGREKSKDPVQRKVVATVYAPKGGVGKTTMAANLACLFQLFGARTLVIDLDFQSNLTLFYGYDSEITLEEALANQKSPDCVVERHFGNLVPDWPAGRSALADVIKKPYGEFGPHLIPADLTLDRLDTMLTFDAIEGRKADFKIASMLQEGMSGKNPFFDLSKYDVILFDAAPAKNRMTRGALLASDFVISPVSMEKFSTKALSYLSSVLGDMREQVDRSPELVIVGNFFDSTKLRVMAQMMTIANTYQGALLGQTIRRSEEFPKTLTLDDTLPLALSKHSSEPARELQLVALALLERMGVLDTANVEQFRARFEKATASGRR